MLLRKLLTCSLLITSLLLFFLLLGSLFLRVDKDIDLAHHLDELHFTELKEGIARFGSLAREDSLKQILVLEEGTLGVRVVHPVENGVLTSPLLDIDISVLEHLIERILVGHAGLIGTLVGLKVADTEQSRQELGVVHATLDVQSVVNRDKHTVDLVK